MANLPERGKGTFRTRGVFFQLRSNFRVGRTAIPMQFRQFGLQLRGRFLERSGRLSKRHEKARVKIHPARGHSAFIFPFGGAN